MSGKWFLSFQCSRHVPTCFQRPSPPVSQAEERERGGHGGQKRGQCGGGETETKESAMMIFFHPHSAHHRLGGFVPHVCPLCYWPSYDVVHRPHCSLVQHSFSIQCAPIYENLLSVVLDIPDPIENGQKTYSNLICQRRKEEEKMIAGLFSLGSCGFCHIEKITIFGR